VGASDGGDGDDESELGNEDGKYKDNDDHESRLKKMIRVY